MSDSRTILMEGQIEVGSWVVVTGPRYHGRKGKVLAIRGTAFPIAAVCGDFGSWANRGRVEREFALEHLSLYSEDVDSGKADASS
jgi:hypothetical protein